MVETDPNCQILLIDYLRERGECVFLPKKAVLFATFVISGENSDRGMLTGNGLPPILKSQGD
jgi:hypothetical protein